MTVVYRKELKQYFTGMLGYVFIAFILFILGIFSAVINLQYMYPSFEIIFSNAKFLYLIAIPILTMNIMAGEKRQNTDQLLLTSPISLTKIIMGKYLAMLTVLLIPIAVVCFYPLILSAFGPLSMGTIYSTAFCFFFLGAALIAIGMFISCLTDNQILAAVICLGVLMASYFMSNFVTFASSSSIGSIVAFTVVVIILTAILWLMTKNGTFAITVGVILEIFLLVIHMVNAALLEQAFKSVLTFLEVFDPLDNFATTGSLSIATLVYYLSIAFLFIFFSIQSLEKKRWS